MREQVERLEHHVHLLPHLRDVRLVREDVVAVDEDGSAGRMIQKVETAQERALAGARRTDDRDHFALADLGVDALQHLEAAVALGQVLDLDHRATAFCRRYFGSVFRSRYSRACISTQAMTKYSTATMISGKNGSKVRLRMMSLAL